MGELSSQDRSNDDVNQGPLEFGHACRNEFLFDPKFKNMNHGSFGTYPHPVRTTLRKYQDAAEARPDDFIRYIYPRELDKSRAALADLLSCPIDTLVFVPNATTGVNTVLRNLTFEPGDKILYFATIYGACEKSVEFICETTPAESVKIEYEYPVEDSFFTEALREKVQEEEKKGCRVKLAVFDTVVSLPGVRMPFEELTKTCKELRVMSCIDGAHGIGQVELKLGEGEGKLDCDFLVSNCHKWLFTPRGSAMFYVPIRNQHLMRSTLPTSHGFTPLPHAPSPTSGSKPKAIANPLPPSRNSPYVTNFEFVGTIDSSPYLCLPTALQFRSRLGSEKAIRDYCTRLAREGGARVASVLGTKILDNKAGTLGNCFFAMVLLPLSPSDLTTLSSTKLGRDVEQQEVVGKVRDWISQTSVTEYDTFFALIFYGGEWWVRLSGAVYLEMADFDWSAKVLNEMCDRAKNGEFLN